MNPEELDLIDTLRADGAFLRYYLTNYVVHVPVKNERGAVVNGFAAVQIPDWAVKQRLADIDAAILKHYGITAEEAAPLKREDLA